MLASPNKRHPTNSTFFAEEEILIRMKMLQFLVTSIIILFSHAKQRSFRLWHRNPTTNNRTSQMMELPELVAECILEKLPPEGLCVCRSMRERCRSDHLWEKHMRSKWGGIVGCHLHIAASTKLDSKQHHFWMRWLWLWPFAAVKKSCAPLDSIMACYLALEKGRFCFPAQVYNRENGHVGFLLSCYDATLTYNRKSDTFDARYPAHGARASVVETGVRWKRVRRSPVETILHDLHISDCLYHLKPDDELEIQWRRKKDFPYESVVVEFKQYARGSRWIRTIVNRKEHREEGNEVDGFYGGIRKLISTEEISVWKKMWPPHVLE